MTLVFGGKEGVCSVHIGTGIHILYIMYIFMPTYLLTWMGGRVDGGALNDTPYNDNWDGMGMAASRSLRQTDQ